MIKHYKNISTNDEFSSLLMSSYFRMFYNDIKAEHFTSDLSTKFQNKMLEH